MSIAMIFLYVVAPLSFIPGQYTWFDQFLNIFAGIPLNHGIVIHTTRLPDLYRWSLINLLIIIFSKITASNLSLVVDIIVFLTHTLYGNGIVVCTESEFNRAVSSVIGGCATMDRAGQIAINTRMWVQPHRARHRASAERKARVRRRCPVGYQRTADKVS